MEFLEHPLRLLHILWLTPLVAVLVFWTNSTRKRVLRSLFGTSTDNSEVTTLSLGRRYTRLWLLFASLLLLTLAYARPRWGWRILPFSGRGRDLMVLMDVSKSMLSEDVKPSRLKHAKQFVRELMESTPGNRYGLVDFAGTAFLECPMTVDKTSLFQALDELNVNSIPVGGTNIENALKKAMLAFKAAEGGYKAIILVTDGDELYGDSSRIVSKLKNNKTPLFVVGIGDPDGDGLIKMTDGQGKTKLMRDSMGKLVKSRLNEKALRLLAERTGGIYVRSTETNLGIAPIRKRIKSLVPKEYSKGNCKRPIERFHYPLLLAILLLLVRMAIGERRRVTANAVVTIIALSFLFGFSPTTLSAQNATQTSPVPLPTASHVATEEKHGEKVEKPKKLAPVAIYNQALKLHKKRKFKEAADLYRKAVNMSNASKEVRSKAFQNLGVISHQKGAALLKSNPDASLKIFNKAEQMYKESMRSDVRRKRVVLNQQRLLDDRRLAKLIKKRQEEMRKKREQARKQTQKALNQQKKENQKKKQKNQSKQNKKQKRNNESKSQKQRQQNGEKKKSQKSERNGNKSEKQQQNKEQKRNQNKKTEKSGDNKQKRQENNQQQQKSSMKSNAGNKETEQKIKQAETAAEDYKNAAKRAASRKDEKIADEAKREIEKARKKHEKDKGDESEKHLKNALKKLAQANKNKDDKGCGENKNSNKPSDEKKKSKGGKGDKKSQARKKPVPKPNQANSKSGAGRKGGKEKKIDPAQAAALLDMMANDEKKFRDAIKKRQRRNADVSKIPKDW